MADNPLREEQVKQLIGQLRGVASLEGRRLVATWLAEDRITKADLVAHLNPYEGAALLGAPAPPFPNHAGRMALMDSVDGRARVAEWAHAAAEWRRAYLGNPFT